MKSRSGIFCVLLLASISGLCNAADFGAWTMRSKLTLTGYGKSETLTNFPVLVKLDPAGIGGFSYNDFQTAGGGDLRFTKADKSTELRMRLRNGIPRAFPTSG